MEFIAPVPSKVSYCDYSIKFNFDKKSTNKTLKLTKIEELEAKCLIKNLEVWSQRPDFARRHPCVCKCRSNICAPSICDVNGAEGTHSFSWLFRQEPKFTHFLSGCLHRAQSRLSGFQNLVWITLTDESSFNVLCLSIDDNGAG